jgi:hypothetical protein
MQKGHFIGFFVYFSTLPESVPQPSMLRCARQSVCPSHSLRSYQMSPRQARRERREAERKARKAEIKRLKAARHIPTDAPKQNPAGFVMPPGHPAELREQNPDREGGVRATAPPPEFSAPNPPGFVSQSDEPALLSEAKIQTRREINRANAQHSTGPRSIAGKLASSRNSLRHGLASGTLIIPGEDPAAFEQLTAALLEEHQPAGDTETLLVHEMARSWWLTQRAIRLQNDCFKDDGGIDEKRLALLLRYQTTHERAFHKALNTLLKLIRSRDRRERCRPSNASGFVSHANPSSAPELGFVSQNPAAGAPIPAPTLAEAA